MLYKTITLELLQDQPQLYDQLLRNRTLLHSLESYASELRNRHLSWKELLRQARPGSDPMLIANEALELATEELMSDLASDPTPSVNKACPQDLDGAMAFIRNHSSLA